MYSNVRGLSAANAADSRPDSIAAVSSDSNFRMNVALLSAIPAPRITSSIVARAPSSIKVRLQLTGNQTTLWLQHRYRHNVQPHWKRSVSLTECHAVSHDARSNWCTQQPRHTLSRATQKHGPKSPHLQRTTEAQTKADLVADIQLLLQTTTVQTCTAMAKNTRLCTHTQSNTHSLTLTHTLTHTHAHTNTTTAH